MAWKKDIRSELKKNKQTTHSILFFQNLEQIVKKKYMK